MLAVDDTGCIHTYIHMYVNTYKLPYALFTRSGAVGAKTMGHAVGSLLPIGLLAGHIRRT